MPHPSRSRDLRLEPLHATIAELQQLSLRTISQASITGAGFSTSTCLAAGAVQLREPVEYTDRRGWQIASEYLDRMSGKYEHRPKLRASPPSAASSSFPRKVLQIRPLPKAARQFAMLQPLFLPLAVPALCS